MSALAQTKPYITPEQYLIFEREALDQRHEYFDGEIFIKEGGTYRHNLISIAIIGMAYSQLINSSYEMFASNMRVKVEQTSAYIYPDIAAVSENPQFEDQEFDTLLNPILIIEILSKGTENNDRGKKFENYRKIKSLREYLLVSQEEIHIEHFQRQDDNSWTFRDYTLPEEMIILSSINVQLVLADIYAKITF